MQSLAEFWIKDPLNELMYTNLRPWILPILDLGILLRALQILPMVEELIQPSRE